MSRKAVETYISSVDEKLKTGQAREHAYRPCFEALIHALDPKLKIVNDPSRSEHGNPDFVFLRGDITAGYAETKDLNDDLDKTEKSEQMKRYLGYSNLILTDYLEFRFFRNGSRYGEPIRIATVSGGKLEERTETYDELATALADFLAGTPEPIKNGKRLAEIMGGKARRIRDNVHRFLTDKADSDTDLLRIYESIKKMLVHDLPLEAFADMYAQTLVYGLFVARYHDDSVDTFSRSEARDLVPESNPFLRQFFNHIAGPDFNKRLRYIVDELCVVFATANVRELMEQYFKLDLWGKEHGGPDPVIHFYEDFLKEYDAELRKKMGAYYTPLPVVRFIVRAIDHVLKTDFGLGDGLADTTKLSDGRHKVQVLDPAVGTGTFISAVIRNIYERFVKQGQKGRWPTYVHYDLLPRIHGFELMMTAYTIAHLKLSIAFKQTGFTIFNKRLGIYLTNSLEEAGPQTDMFSLGFAQSIAEEAKQAAVIKNETPIMVVLGNPPYSGESSNAFYKEHDAYKIEPTGGKLKERNSKWINDDYVKFIRLAESLVEKNGEGVVAMITAHGYLDNPTFRGMRWHLMQTFEKIYVLDLHGNANKKEKAPDGSEDKNVFDIMTGVSILIGVKHKKSADNLATVFRADCFGARKLKIDFLESNSLDTISWQKLRPSAPNYEWAANDGEVSDEYKRGFSVTELFTVSSVGIVTSRDDFVIDMDKHTLSRRIEGFLQSATTQEALSKYGLKENLKWKAVQALKHKYDEARVIPVSYRPFDSRFIYYHDDFIERPRGEVMQYFVGHENIGLVTNKRIEGPRKFADAFLSDCVTDARRVSLKETNYIFPLYLYAEDGTRVSNLSQGIMTQIANSLGSEPSPENIFYYVYAGLHSPSYREKHNDFLKATFPRVPYPKDKNQFMGLAALGKELRELHLLESQKVRKYITSYPESGSNVVEKIARKGDGVYINETQHFGGVPDIAWNFYIGSYQPAQKWLKDRKGRTLTNENIEHYQKIIVALVETDRIMKEIDKAV
ncbi:N-6 DNA methylase [Candidatus Kaiserbacteria bacterium]|nr:N-6 DNA methylase [Candidatus Kaiserbacteria bacterium]